MRGILLGFAAAGSAWLTGCAGVVSLHPLVADGDKDAMIEPALVGFWKKAQADQEICLIQRKGRTGYTLTGTDKGETITVSMQAFRVGDRYLLDILDDAGDPAMPVHVYFGMRLDPEKKTMWVAEMQSEWLKQQIAASGQPRNEVLTEEGVQGKVVITAPQADLRKYLLPYAADSRAYDKEMEFQRIQ